MEPTLHCLYSNPGFQIKDPYPNTQSVDIFKSREATSTQAYDLWLRINYVRNMLVTQLLVNNFQCSFRI